MESGVQYRPPLTTHSSAVEGAAYYRADAFGKSARGDVFLAYYKESSPTGMLRVSLSSDG